MTAGLHPYVPEDLVLPDFQPGRLSQPAILGGYAISSLLIVLLVWFFSGRFGIKSKTDRSLMCWWIFTGLTHIVLEGYFVFSPEFYKDKTHFYLSEVWKEYSKGDSRYASRDSAVVAVEGITSILVGPASLLSMYAIALKKPYGHTLQFAISLCQLYGAVVYFLTAILEGDNFATNRCYYYAYYVGANFVWFVIPSFIAIRCWRKLSSLEKKQRDKEL